MSQQIIIIIITRWNKLKISGKRRISGKRINFELAEKSYQ